MAQTYWVSVEGKLYRNSGQFTSVVLDSLDVSAIGTSQQDISWDGVNTLWSKSSITAKLYLQSGNFSSTIKTSLADSVLIRGLGADSNGNVPVSGTGSDKLYKFSGKFSSTVKDSVSISGESSNPTGISFDGTDIFWTSNNPTSKLYKQSGYFTSTLKTSLDVSAINVATGGAFNGVDCLWSGFNPTDTLYLQSGYFSSTIKTSLNIVGGITPAGVDTSDYLARQGVIPLKSGVLPSRESQVPRKDELKEKVEADSRKTEEEAWMVEKVMTRSELEKEKIIEDTNALIMGVRDLI